MKSLFCFLILSGWFVTANASDQWYGEVRVKKVIKEDTVEVFEPGHSYHPGTESRKGFAVWKGSVEILPSDKVVTHLSYRQKLVVNRLTEKEISCFGKQRQYRDRETQFVETEGEGSFETTNHFTMYLDSDGSYDDAISVDSDGITDGVTRSNTIRDTFNACYKDPHSRSDNKVSIPALIPGVMVFLKGKAKPNTMIIEGHNAWDDYDGGKVEASWRLTRKSPKVRAVIKGTKTIERGSVITLNGTSSTGAIKNYLWEFEIDGDCYGEVEEEKLTLKGKKVSFKALCHFTAFLTVEDGDTSHTSSYNVEVVERKGPKWRTRFSSKKGHPLTSKIFYELMPLGVNQCAFHSGDETSGHYIHTDDRGNKTWKDSGYTIAKVQDGGPFSGLYYIESQKLEVNRLERVNKNLLPGGEVYQLNEAQNNLANLNALAIQVKVHEKAHSTLLELALQELGEERDPAHKIESLVLLTEEEMIFWADFHVRDANTLLKSNTSEPNVKALLDSQGFSQEVSVWFQLTTPKGTPAKFQEKPMGRLSDIGDDGK